MYNELDDGPILKLIIGWLRFSLAANSAQHLEHLFKVKFRVRPLRYFYKSYISTMLPLLLDPCLQWLNKNNV